MPSYYLQEDNESRLLLENGTDILTIELEEVTAADTLLTKDDITRGVDLAIRDLFFVSDTDTEDYTPGGSPPPAAQETTPVYFDIPWTQQPPAGTQINPYHELGRHVVGAWNGADPYREIVSNRGPISINNPTYMSFTVGPQGHGVRFTGPSGTDFTSQPSLQFRCKPAGVGIPSNFDAYGLLTQSCSMVVVFRVRSATEAYAAVASFTGPAGGVDSGTDTGWGSVLYADGASTGSVGAGWSGNNGVNVHYPLDARVSDTNDKFLTVVFQHNVSDGGSGGRGGVCWVNGNYTVTTLTGNSTEGFTILDRFSVGSIKLSAFLSACGTDADVYFAAVFAKRMTDGEAKSLCANPWQLFKPRRFLMRVGVDAATSSPLPFFVRVPWKQQPPAGVRVDRSHPIARGMVNAFNGAQPHADPLTGKRWDTYGTSVPIRPGAGGEGVNTGTGNPRLWSMSNLPGMVAGVNGSTNSEIDSTQVVVVRFRSVSTGSGADAHAIVGMVNHPDPGSISAWERELFVQADGAVGSRVYDGSDNRCRSWPLGSEGTVTLGKVHVIAQTVAYPRHALFFDGKSADDVSVSNNGYQNWANQPFHTFGSPVTTFPQTADYDILGWFAWSRRLTNEEIVAFSKNPWQVFEPRRFLMRVDAGASAPPSGGTLYEVSIADGMYMFDPTTARDEHHAFLDGLFMRSDRANDLHRLLGDSTFLVDSLLSSVERSLLAVDQILLGDGTSKEVYLAILDGLLLGDAASLEQLSAAILRQVDDGLYVKDDTMREVLLAALDFILLSDAGASQREKVVEALDALFLADAVFGTTAEYERADTDKLFLTESLRREFELVANVDKLFLYESLVEALKNSTAVDITIADYLFVADAQANVLEKLIVDSVLVADGVARELERLLGDRILIGETQDRLREVYAVAVDGLLMLDACVRDHHLTALDGLMLSDDAAALREVLREVADKFMLADSGVRERELTISDVVLVNEAASLLRELLVKDGLIVDDAVSRVVIGVIREFLTYARLRAFKWLGVETRAIDYMGRLIDAIDLLGREIKSAQWRLG